MSLFNLPTAISASPHPGLDSNRYAPKRYVYGRGSTYGHGSATGGLTAWRRWCQKGASVWVIVGFPTGPAATATAMPRAGWSGLRSG